MALDPSASELTIGPTTQHTHTVIFLHGRGDTAPSFRRWFDHWRDTKNRTLMQAFPSYKWVFPTASVNSQSMSQWFDIWDTRDFSLREELQAEGLRPSVTRIRALLGREVTAVDGDWKRIIVMGISQGAATAVHTILNTSLVPAGEGGPLSRGLGAFIGFSCRMPFPGRSLGETRKVLGVQYVHNGDNNTDNDEAEVLRNTPVLLEHCVDDPTVRVEDGRILRDTLRRFGANATMVEYPEGGHWFHGPDGLDDVIAFLSKHTAAATSAKTTA
mgnify:CR=1 FL=1